METATELRMQEQPKSPAWYAEQQRLFLEAIEPITRLKAYLYSIYLPTIIVDSKGNLLSSAYPDDIRSKVEQLDSMIQQVARQWDKPGT